MKLSTSKSAPILRFQPLRKPLYQITTILGPGLSLLLLLKYPATDIPVHLHTAEVHAPYSPFSCFVDNPLISPTKPSLIVFISFITKYLLIRSRKSNLLSLYPPNHPAHLPCPPSPQKKRFRKNNNNSRNYLSYSYFFSCSFLRMTLCLIFTTAKFNSTSVSVVRVLKL